MVEHNSIQRAVRGTAWFVGCGGLAHSRREGGRRASERSPESGLNRWRACTPIAISARMPAAGIDVTANLADGIIAALDHPHTSVRCTNSGLSALGQALPVDQASTIGIQIVSALDMAQRQEITHRDLKPGNIMLTKAGARLDFGLGEAWGGKGRNVSRSSPRICIWP